MKFKQPISEAAAMRTIISILLVALVFATLGAWLFWQDRAKLNAEIELRKQQSVLEARMIEAEQRIESLSPQIAPEEQKVAQTEKIIRQLEELQSTWDLVSPNRAQQRANRERLESMQALHATTVAKVAELQNEIARAKWERDTHEIERARIDSQLRVTEAAKAGSGYWIRRGWVAARSWICFAVALYLLGPIMVPMILAQRRRRNEGVIVGGRGD